MHTDAMLSLEEMESEDCALNNKLYDGTRLLVSMVANALACMQEEDWLAMARLYYFRWARFQVYRNYSTVVCADVDYYIILKGEIQTTINLPPPPP